MNWKNRPLDLPDRSDLTEGYRYPAKLHVIQQGSCVPAYLELLSDNILYCDVVLPLEDDDQEPEKTTRLIHQVVKTTKQLITDWPEIQLLVCDQGTDEYSARYRWGLARRYEARFKQLFVEEGLSPEAVKIAYGELYPKLRPADLDSVNGVQVFFQLKLPN